MMQKNISDKIAKIFYGLLVAQGFFSIVWLVYLQATTNWSFGLVGWQSGLLRVVLFFVYISGLAILLLLPSLIFEREDDVVVAAQSLGRMFLVPWADMFLNVFLFHNDVWVNVIIRFVLLSFFTGTLSLFFALFITLCNSKNFWRYFIVIIFVPVILLPIYLMARGFSWFPQGNGLILWLMFLMYGVVANSLEVGKLLKRK